MRDHLAAILLLIPALNTGPELSMAFAANTRTPDTSSNSDQGWPRQYSDGRAKLVLYQPQVDSWTDFRKLAARFVISLMTSRNAQPVWGVLYVEADTSVNRDSRVVAFDTFKIASVSYPAAKGVAESTVWSALTRKLLPERPAAIAVQRILAYMDPGLVNSRQTEVLLDPPAILVSTQPAVLVIIDGQPLLMDIEETNLQKVLNTNWDLFFDKRGSRYYLRDEKTWFSAKDLTEGWTAVTKLPKDFGKLPATDQYQEVKQSILDIPKPAVMKLVLVLQKPAELIVVKGHPSFLPIAGTDLMWVTNTECDVFFHRSSAQFYFLTSGRWFRAAELKSNGWVAATTSLPIDFKKIPRDHPRAHVLAAVPGTRQAEEAVLSASIPQTATIDRKSAKAVVQYVGDQPKFELIEGTVVSYAANTPNDVFRVNDRFYLCLEGVWFISREATGPWAITAEVPAELYAIPPSSPKYHVTYVTIYDSTADSVTFGYTAGYTGVYIGYGVAMWGTGYYYPPYYGNGYYPYPVYWPGSYYTYGVSAWYNPATGGYRRGSAVYGPYGGYARGAAYNPANGRYSWGRSVWGPYGTAASGGFYNPTTGGWARTGSYSGSRGAIAGIQTSSGGKALVAAGDQSRGFAARSAAGDFYAGKDGNVYKRDQSSGQWYKNNGGAWENVNRDAAPGNLNRDASARNWGNYNTQRSESARKSSGWSSGGFTGQRTSGWAARSPGFGGGRRR
jgi:hypothetical protein